MNYSIKHLFHINTPIEVVFKALTTIEDLSKWWTTETSGEAHAGGIIQFRFNGSESTDMKVTEFKENEMVSWACVASPWGWKGHHFSFQLDENEGKTRVRFTHGGWEEDGDFYAGCSFSWARYMESLRQLCHTGKGEGLGTAGYRK